MWNNYLLLTREREREVQPAAFRLNIIKWIFIRKRDILHMTCYQERWFSYNIYILFSNFPRQFMLINFGFCGYNAGGWSTDAWQVTRQFNREIKFSWDWKIQIYILSIPVVFDSYSWRHYHQEPHHDVASLRCCWIIFL